MKMLFFYLLFSLLSCLQLSAEPFHLELVESAYRDDELEDLWASLTDLYNPTCADFLKIEHYLKFGRRPYLDGLFEQGIARGWGPVIYNRAETFTPRILQKMRLVGANGEMPLFERRIMGGVSAEDLSRCIVLYVSHNNDPLDGRTSYAEKMFLVMKELETSGYKGHVLFRLGGYPLLNKGGIRLAHVPYSFKVLSLIEASHLGYNAILWLDVAVHPTNDLAQVFSCLQNEGVFLLENGIALDYDYDFGIIPAATVASCQLGIQDLTNYPHVVATIIGVSFNSRAGHELIKEWYQLTAQVYPAMSFYPEEFLLSIAAKRSKNKPTGHIGNYMDVRSAIPVRPTQAVKPFWFDKS